VARPHDPRAAQTTAFERPVDCRQSPAAISQHGSYRGPDRRDRLTGDAAPVALFGRSLAVLVLISVPVGFALAANEGLAVATETLRVLTAILVVTGGVASIINWRVNGLAFAGRFGGALVTFGVLCTAEFLLLGLAKSPDSSFEAAQTFVTVAIVGVMAVRAAWGQEVDSNLRPLRYVASGLASGLVGIGTLHFLAAKGIVVTSLGAHVQRLLLAAAAGVWVVISVSFAVMMKRRSTVPPWSALAIWVFAVGAVFRAVEPSSSPLGLGLVPSLVTGLASAMVMTAALVEVVLVLSAADRTSLRLRIDLDSTNEEMRSEQDALEERLHALRNAIMAMRSANWALQKFAGAMESAERAKLVDALAVELERAQCLVEPRQERRCGAGSRRSTNVRTPRGDQRHGRRAVAMPIASGLSIVDDRTCVDFPLTAVLQPMVALERSYGVQLDVQLGDLWAHGNPRDLAEVLQHLLVNARKYAPGAPVQLVARERPGRVEVRVRDRGPGIPDAERIAVFARGARGSSASGTDGEGLGLHVAARLVAAMGGQLRLEPEPGPGACFLVELGASGHGSTGHSAIAVVSGGSAPVARSGRGPEARLAARSPRCA
jgi:signal transduction histidine kinase